jgi:hypothetical protein
VVHDFSLQFLNDEVVAEPASHEEITEKASNALPIHVPTDIQVLAPCTSEVEKHEEIPEKASNALPIHVPTDIQVLDPCTSEVEKHEEIPEKASNAFPIIVPSDLQFLDPCTSVVEKPISTEVRDTWQPNDVQILETISPSFLQYILTPTINALDKVLVKPESPELFEASWLLDAQFKEMSTNNQCLTLTPKKRPYYKP